MPHDTDFPGFAGDVKIPSDFTDSSWQNDACPCFIAPALGLCLWVDHPDTAAREYPEGPRFILQTFGQDGQHLDDPETVLESDVWTEIEAAITARSAETA